jgi:hypothetical protein
MAAAAKRTCPEDDEAEDVHHFVEKQLAARIGEAGYKLHSGRSRNEQIATDLRLYVRAAIDELRKSNWPRSVERSPTAPNKPAMPPCLLTRICSTLSRC